MMLPQCRSRISSGGERADDHAALDIRGMRQEKAKDLAARVPTGTGYGNSDRLVCSLALTRSHAYQYASLCIRMHNYLSTRLRVHGASDLVELGLRRLFALVPLLLDRLPG